METVYRILFTLTLSFGHIYGMQLKIDPFPENGKFADVYNSNCFQMTQSQQMLKAYIMVGLNSTFDSPKESLRAAIPLYDKRFKKIKEYFQKKVKDRDVSRLFDEAQNIWDESRKILEKRPHREGALKLKSNFKKMIALLSKGSKLSSDEGLEILSITGKLCRAPMKISIDYLMRIWGVDIPDYERDVADIIQTFYRYLDRLKNDRLNSKETIKLLRSAKKGFMFFEMMYKSKTNFIPSLLSRKADENFEIIRKIKMIYKETLFSDKTD
jgi:hypothetical protein